LNESDCVGGEALRTIDACLNMGIEQAGSRRGASRGRLVLKGCQDSCIAYHAVPANRRGFRVNRDPCNSGRLERSVAVCEPNSHRFRCSAPKIARQSARKIPFPGPREGEAGAEASRSPN